ncbi:MAG TPA: M35 family metallo-endopeptidase [Thermoanaerobaculia bacterium]|nr:M35 family metallo-endopeptidase [Thermoanaerobaculia bacterium]
MSRQNGVNRFLIAFVLALLVGATAASAATRSLSSEIRAEKPSVSATDDVFVHFTLRNESSEDLYVLSWQTPLRGVQEHIFEVRRNGQPVDYIGRLYKWATPTAQDFIRIPAGKSVSTRVELSSVYDISRSGEYTIQYRVPVREALRATGSKVAAAAVGDIESNAVVLGVERDERSITQQAATDDQPNGIFEEYVTPGYVSCSNTRQSTLVTATSNAESMSLKARNYLNNLPSTSRPTDTAYKTWFGSYTTSRYSTVQSHFNKIYSAFNTKKFTYYCDCTSSAYAYVYANQPYNVHLCNAFWNAPMTGIDSKAGTLIHEASHFTVLGGTQDYAYGTTNARNLAISNPDRAVMNADNHEYFAETR